MIKYKLEWKRSAVKELLKLDKRYIANILGQVEKLSENPVPPGVKKLMGTENTYRIRIGNYRIIYEIEKANIIIRIHY